MIVDLTGNDVHNAVRSLKNDISFGLLNQTIVIDSIKKLNLFFFSITVWK